MTLSELEIANDHLARLAREFQEENRKLKAQHEEQQRRINEMIARLEKVRF